MLCSDTKDKNPFSLFSQITNKSERIPFLSELLSRENLLLYRYSRDHQTTLMFWLITVLIHLAFKILLRSLRGGGNKMHTNPTQTEYNSFCQYFHYFFSFFCSFPSEVFIMFYLHIWPKESYTQEMLVIVISFPPSGEVYLLQQTFMVPQCRTCNNEYASEL